MLAIPPGDEGLLVTWEFVMVVGVIQIEGKRHSPWGRDIVGCSLWQLSRQRFLKLAMSLIGLL